MPTYIDILDDSDQTAAPTATALDAATGDIYTRSYCFMPRYVVGFGMRVTTAWGVAAATPAKWRLQLLGSDDSTVTTKAALTFNQASAAIGDVIYDDLEGRQVANASLAFVQAPGQRLRVNKATQGVATGGSAIGAGVPMIAWKQHNLGNPMATTFTSSPAVVRATATAS